MLLACKATTLEHPDPSPGGHDDSQGCWGPEEDPSQEVCHLFVGHFKCANVFRSQFIDLAIVEFVF